MVIEHIRRVEHMLGADAAIWLVDLDAYAKAVRLDDLAPEELARAKRLTPDKAGMRFLASRHALRSLLAEALGCARKSLAIGQNEFGKPMLASNEIHFSLSRSESGALVGISRSIEVGVDLETVRAVQEMEALAKLHLTAAERAHWLNAIVDRRDREFLGIWTLKEACLKALGTGVALQPSSVETSPVSESNMASVRLGEKAIQLSISPVQVPGDMVAAAALATSQAVRTAKKAVGPSQESAGLERKLSPG